ncbi:helix-turn-helix domain-containing protein [Rhizobium sp. C4]|uniref:helix-turn-helix domain-containing protein n=1 Tax=Rhizobium sp. C4 TaxID=1349800 RepID=UPI001E35484D|nr:helix-turn-helix transcriptional regulator [Rhizobium sp. C4]MCD2175603.1 helix-turn-helix transcriptional regulator [Rhizobium sp. C4]
MEIDIQRITLDGKNYVMLSEDDFEDLIDGLKAQAILARVEAGEETWPMELVEELCETDSRIRTYRKYRGLTMTELATAAGISQPHLSDIENGKKTGSVDVLKRIATALKVDLDDLVV